MSFGSNKNEKLRENIKTCSCQMLIYRTAYMPLSMFSDIEQNHLVEESESLCNGHESGHPEAARESFLVFYISDDMCLYS